MADTSIQWTDKTWNPVRGCSVVSPGCVNCYAMKQAHRFSGPGRAYEGLTKQTKAGPQWTGKIRLVEDHLSDPLTWRNPARVFVNSMSDLFHESVPDEFISDVFAIMAIAKEHTFQILTKRADRMREWVKGHMSSDGKLIQYVRPTGRDWICAETYQMPLPNVWLGVSVENQKYAGERIPLLLQTPAAIRFISAEPLLGPLDLGFEVCYPGELPGYTVRGKAVDQLDWVIVGGESGNGARPCDIAWVQSVVDQCAEAKAPCFVKQLGAWPVLSSPCAPAWQGVRVTARSGGKDIVLSDKKGGAITEWPADLQVREFPSGAVRA